MSVYKQVLSSPHPLPKCYIGEKSCYRRYKEFKLETFFPRDLSGLSYSDAMQFYSEALELLKNEMDRLGEKYSRLEDRLTQYFEKAVAFINVNQKDQLRSILEEINRILQNEDGIYEDLKVFQAHLKKIEPRYHYLKTTRAEIESEYAKRVTFPDPFFGEPIIIHKDSETWEEECALLESFYVGYSRLLNTHIHYLNHMILAYHRLREVL